MEVNTLIEKMLSPNSEERNSCITIINNNSLNQEFHSIIKLKWMDNNQNSSSIKVCVLILKNIYIKRLENIESKLSISLEMDSLKKSIRLLYIKIFDDIFGIIINNNVNFKNKILIGEILFDIMEHKKKFFNIAISNDLKSFFGEINKTYFSNNYLENGLETNLMIGSIIFFNNLSKITLNNDISNLLLLREFKNVFNYIEKYKILVWLENNSFKNIEIIDNDIIKFIDFFYEFKSNLVCNLKVFGIKDKNKLLLSKNDIGLYTSIFNFSFKENKGNNLFLFEIKNFKFEKILFDINSLKVNVLNWLLTKLKIIFKINLKYKKNDYLKNFENLILYVGIIIEKIIENFLILPQFHNLNFVNEENDLTRFSVQINEYVKFLYYWSKEQSFNDIFTQKGEQFIFGFLIYNCKFLQRNIEFFNINEFVDNNYFLINGNAENNSEKIDIISIKLIKSIILKNILLSDLLFDFCYIGLLEILDSSTLDISQINFLNSKIKNLNWYLVTDNNDKVETYIHIWILLKDIYSKNLEKLLKIKLLIGKIYNVLNNVNIFIESKYLILLLSYQNNLYKVEYNKNNQDQNIYLDYFFKYLIENKNIYCSYIGLSALKYLLEIEWVQKNILFLYIRKYFSFIENFLNLEINDLVFFIIKFVLFDYNSYFKSYLDTESKFTSLIKKIFQKIFSFFDNYNKITDEENKIFTNLVNLIKNLNDWPELIWNLKEEFKIFLDFCLKTVNMNLKHELDEEFSIISHLYLKCKGIEQEDIIYLDNCLKIISNCKYLGFNSKLIILFLKSNIDLGYMYKNIIDILFELLTINVTNDDKNEEIYLLFSILILKNINIINDNFIKKFISFFIEFNKILLDPENTKFIDIVENKLNLCKNNNFFMLPILALIYKNLLYNIFNNSAEYLDFLFLILKHSNIFDISYTKNLYILVLISIIKNIDLTNLIKLKSFNILIILIYIQYLEEERLDIKNIEDDDQYNDRSYKKLLKTNQEEIFYLNQQIITKVDSFNDSYDEDYNHNILDKEYMFEDLNLDFINFDIFELFKKFYIDISTNKELYNYLIQNMNNNYNYYLEKLINIQNFKCLDNGDISKRRYIIN